MANSQFRRQGISQQATVDLKKTGIKVDPGPYVATVVGHIKGPRLGQLEVYVPEWGGEIDDKSTYVAYTVSYCSPFYGKTFGTDTQLLPDSPATSGQSYGMWFVPPDIGNKVLVIFANGDRDRGYWIGCIYDGPSHHMVPGIARNIGGPDKTLVPEGSQSTQVGNNSVVPVIEYNAARPEAFGTDALTATPRQPHQYQFQQLINQGLDRDKIRGAISSSSMREAPSNVYGISTPGRKSTATDQVPGEPEAVIYRRGGHQFVMDDGAAGDSVTPAGTDQLIRLRSSGGHQILMNDTENVVYVASASGRQWLEFSADGSINVYGQSGINMRTEGVMNMHADGAIIMQSPIIEMNSSGQGTSAIIMNTTGQLAVKSIMGTSIASDGPVSISTMTMGSFKAGATMNISAVGLTSVYGSLLKLNTGFPGVPDIVTGANLNNLQDTKFLNGNWIAQPGTLATACTVVPAHEPWVASDGKRRPPPQVPGQGSSAIGTVLLGASLAGLGSSIAGSLLGGI